MNSTDYLADPSGLTTEQSRMQFAYLVQEAQRVQGLEFTRAWNATKVLYPALAAKAFEVTPPLETRVKMVPVVQTPALVPAAPYTKSSGLVARNPFVIPIPNDAHQELLGIKGCSYEEFVAASKINGGKVPRESAAILYTLIDLAVGAGRTRQKAEQETRARFPILSAEVPPAK